MNQLAPRRPPNAFEQRCIDHYLQSQDLDATCTALHLNRFSAFKILRFANVLLAKDGVTVGSHGTRLGASAELEFARLVPAAHSMNAKVAACHPGYDFHVNGWRVDVKAFSPAPIKTNTRNPKLSWRAALILKDSDFTTKDLFCIFLAHEREKLIQNCIYKTYLVPVEALEGRRSINKVQGYQSGLDAWEVPPLKIAGFFKEGGAA
jgi:hypothetical protein